MYTACSVHGLTLHLSVSLHCCSAVRSPGRLLGMGSWIDLGLHTRKFLKIPTRTAAQDRVYVCRF